MKWAEIGAAPGGASQALLDEGQIVLGVDPAEVDPVLLADPNFRHLRMRGKEVRRREFRGIWWLAVDVNVAPAYTLDMVEAIVTHRDVSVRGAILTLKLLDWSLAAKIGDYLDRIRSWGFRDVSARQLHHGGQEICVAALRHRSLRRLLSGAAGKRRPAEESAKT
jgi:23S rRNA (cytidine2498-2'-O)-methyltransferase